MFLLVIRKLSIIWVFYRLTPPCPRFKYKHYLEYWKYFYLKKISDSQNESSFRVDCWASSSPWYESSGSGRKVEVVVFSVGSKNRDCMVCSHVDFWNFLIIGIENIRLSHPGPPLRCCQCCCCEMYLSHVTITSSNVTVISDISWGRIRHDRLQGPGDMVTNVSCGGKRAGWMSSNSRSVSVDCWWRRTSASHRHRLLVIEFHSGALLTLH